VARLLNDAGARAEAGRAALAAAERGGGELDRLWAKLEPLLP